MSNPPRLYLASTSPYRSALLSRLGIPFAVESPSVDESPRPGEMPGQRALRLARAKARAVAARHPGDWILGSDQVAICAGRVFDKPGHAAGCREQLQACSGRSVDFYTAIALVRSEPRTATAHVDRTRVQVRRLSPGEIERYVELERPFDCAGSFRVEGLGIALFKAVEASDPTALIGLPLIWVAAALRGVGFDPLAAPQS